MTGTPLPAANEGARTANEPDEPSLSSLRERSVAGGVASVLASLGRALIQFATTVVLARLLSPADFGVVALSGAVVGVLGLFVDPGVSAAMVQRRELSHSQAIVLFWANAGLGLFLSLVATGMGVVLAVLGADARLALVTGAFGVSYAIQSCGVIPQGLMKRRLQFLRLSAIETGSAAAGAVAGVLAAVLGAGVYALVTIPLVAAMIATSITWYSAEWFPSRPRRGSGAHSLFDFARDVTGFNFLNYFSRNADNLLIGTAWGLGSLGHYSRAYALAVTPVAQFTNTLGSVGGPALSRLQSRPDAYRAYFGRVLTLIGLATLPTLVGLALLADDVVLLVLGPQWTESASLVRLLAVAALFQPVVSACSWHYVSLARTKALRVWGPVSTTVTVSAFLAGLPWGSFGVAAAYAVASNALVLPGILWAVRGTPVAFRDVVLAVRSPLAATAIFGCVVTTVRWLAAPLGSVGGLAVSLFAGGASLAAVAFTLPTLRSTINLAMPKVSWRGKVRC